MSDVEVDEQGHPISKPLVLKSAPMKEPELPEAGLPPLEKDQRLRTIPMAPFPEPKPESVPEPTEEPAP